MATSSFVDIVPKDGAPIRIPREAALQSELFRELLEDDVIVDDVVPQLPFTNLDRPSAIRITDYLVYHLNNPPKPIEKPLRVKELEDICDEFDLNLVTCELPELRDLIIASDYCMINSLLDLALSAFAIITREDTLDILSRNFGDIDSATQQKILLNNPWIIEYAKSRKD